MKGGSGGLIMFMYFMNGVVFCIVQSVGCIIQHAEVSIREQFIVASLADMTDYYVAVNLLQIICYNLYMM